ncbi:MAG TPA: prepilin peptidase [Bryobacteraceae bacterium]|nr:prepilin peptidase [Bryobacteraceae bacterium]
MTAQAWIAGIVGVAAIVDDLSRRQISNWISGSAFAAGLVLQTVEGGWRGAGSALLGTLTGAAVFLIFYLLGGMGGGDIKLMAGFGAVLGVKRLLEAALWTAGCGGLLAFAVIAVRTVRDISRKRSSAGAVAAQDASPASEESRRADSIPYAPAIAAGVWLTLVATA